LVSNFTFFLVNPERGDQITQSENRLIFGSNNSYTKRYTLWGLPAKSNSGLGFRHDDVKDVRLSRTQNRDEIIQDLAYGDILETNIHTYTETEVYFTPRWSLNLGLRYDFFNFSYLDKLQADNTETLQAGIVSPKAQLGFQVKENLGLYLKAGTGFHSNDSRAVVSRSTNQILPRAYGLDLGVNWKINPRLLFNAAVWQLDLEQEFVYVGDEGIVEAGGASRRRGIDLGVRYQVLKSLSFDFDMNYADPKSKDEEAGNNFIPLAPTFTSIGGVTYKKSGFTGSVRYRFMDDRAANEDYSLTAKGYYLIDVNLKYRFGAYEIGLSVENVLNTEWNEAQFETESRLQNELQPVSEIHFTPGTPFQARASVAYRF
jgi:outer membrane receptor for monomeric catechols